MLSFLQRKKELIITHEDIIVSQIKVDFTRLDKIGANIRTEQEALKEEINNHKKERDQEQNEKKILDEKIGKLIELNTTIVRQEKKIQRKLREQYELLNTIMENVDIMMWAKGDDGRYLTGTNDFVKSFAKMNSKEEFIGKTDLDIINIYRKKGGVNEFGEICMETDKFTIKKGETCRFIETAKIDHKDVWFDVRKTPVKINSSIIGTVGTAQDVSETVPEIKSFIKSMIKKGKCEVLEENHVWWIKEKRNNH